MANQPTVTSDLSTTITTGGTAQALAAPNAARKVLAVANPDVAEDLWVAFNGLTAAPNGQGSVRVAANGGMLSFAGDAPHTAVSVYAASTGHKITAWEG